MKERMRPTWKKKKQRLLFKCPRCQCNALQGYKASHYSSAFVESSSGQIVTGLFLNRYWEKQAEQRTPNYPVLWGTIKLLIREATQRTHSLSPFPSVCDCDCVCVCACVRACAYGQLAFLLYKALNTVESFGFSLLKREYWEKLCSIQFSTTHNDFHVNKCNKSSVCVLRMLFFGIWNITAMDYIAPCWFGIHVVVYEEWIFAIKKNKHQFTFFFCRSLTICS